MSARSGSLGWVIIAGGVSIGIASAMWGLLDSTFIDVMMSTDSWSAPAGSTIEMGREYVITTWDWFLLVVLIRVGLEMLVSSRLTGASTSLPFATVLVLFLHLFLVLWMLTIPEMAQPIYDIASNSSEVANAGYMEGVDLAYQWGIGVLPAVLLLVADGWFLSAPIRNDMLAR